MWKTGRDGRGRWFSTFARSSAVPLRTSGSSKKNGKTKEAVGIKTTSESGLDCPESQRAACGRRAEMVKTAGCDICQIIGGAPRTLGVVSRCRERDKGSGGKTTSESGLDCPESQRAACGRRAEMEAAGFEICQIIVFAPRTFGVASRCREETKEAVGIKTTSESGLDCLESQRGACGRRAEMVEAAGFRNLPDHRWCPYEPRGRSLPTLN